VWTSEEFLHNRARTTYGTRHADRMTVWRTFAAVTLCTAAVAATAPGRTVAPPLGEPAAPVSYLAPLPEPLGVLRAFDPPDSEFGPGHLGVDLRATDGTTVRAAADGVVAFAGPVAGRGVVVVSHPDGIRTEYEPVRPQVRVGTHVRAGDPIAVLHGRHPGCPGPCLHWGARRGDDYLDPLSLLRPLGPVVLLPDAQARGWAR
jgi:murein DD-endopeptidase MepM/ murein hydrolase activator NlpD